MLLGICGCLVGHVARDIDTGLSLGNDDSGDIGAHAINGDMVSEKLVKNVDSYHDVNSFKFDH